MSWINFCVCFDQHTMLCVWLAVICDDNIDAEADVSVCLSVCLCVCVSVCVGVSCSACVSDMQ